MNLSAYSHNIYKTLSNTEIMRQADNVAKMLKNCDKEIVVYTAGNGGSSANASHFTQDLMKTCNRRSFCLSDNTPYMLAIANDVNFDRVYSSYVALNSKVGDVLFLISGSGNSKNLIEATWIAKSMGVFVVSLVGFDGGVLKEISHMCLHTPLFDMRQAESAQSIVLHYIVEKMNESV